MKKKWAAKPKAPTKLDAEEQMASAQNFTSPLADSCGHHRAIGRCSAGCGDDPESLEDRHGQHGDFTR